MEQYFTGYAQFLQNISKSPHTVKQYVLDAKHFLAFWQEHEKEEFTKILKLYRVYLQEKYTASSMNRKLAGTRKFVHFMYDRNYIQSFNEALFEPIETKEVSLNYLTNPQVNQIKQTLNNLQENATDEEQQFLAARHKAMFALFLTTGIKPFEAIRMKWEHIKGNQLTVLHNESYRRVDVLKSVHKSLYDLKKKNDRLFGENDFVWLGLGNKRGEPITEKTIERFFAMLSSYVGFKVTATMCRYTFMRQADDDIFEKTGYTRKDNMKERLNKLHR